MTWSVLGILIFGFYVKSPPQDELAKSLLKQLADPSITRVTDTYFPVGIEVNMAALPKKSGKLRAVLPWVTPEEDPNKTDAEVYQKPWSGHWWPYAEGQLWKWSDSPLKKYDLYRKARGREGSAAKAESKRQESRETWEGYCEEWAKAGVFTREPKHAVRMLIENEIVEFSIGDIKALLLHTFSGIPRNQQEIYGQVFSPSRKQWLMDDLYPHQVLAMVMWFHEKKKQVFWMDWNPTEEVWTVPVYASLYEIEGIPDRDDAVKLHLSLDFVDSIHSWEDRDSVELKDRSFDYYATLFGTRVGDKLLVHSGVWLKDPNGDSEVNHPDYFLSVKNYKNYGGERKSSNPYIDIDLVDEIAARSYE